MYKVSVIIPIYNTGKYLPECVDSVRNQTLREIEIILVDDESPDESPELCDEYAQQDERITVVHKKNEGLGYARNSGLDVATGEYVIFIDSDDFILPDMLQTLYETAKKYDADEVRSGVIYYENGCFRERADVKEVAVWQGKEQVREFVLDLLGPKPEEKRDVKYMMSVCVGIHRRSVIEEHRVRFTSERKTLSEDLIFDLDLFPHMNSIVYLPEYFYNYRMNPSSLTHTFSMEKYMRVHTFMDVVKNRMLSFYEERDFVLHFLRLMFLYLRVNISNAIKTKESFSTRYRNVKTILNDTLWDELLESYPYKRMEMKHKLYFYLLRQRWSLLTFFANKFFV